MIDGKLTAQDAAEALGISQGAVRRASARGKIAGIIVKVGGIRFLVFSPEEIERYRGDSLGNVGQPRKEKKK